MANTQTLFIEVPIQLISGDLISTVSGTIIEEFISQNSGNIRSSLVFSTDINLDRTITFVDNRIVNASNDIIIEYENDLIGEIEFFFPDFQTTIVSANSQVLPVIGVQTIPSTLTFGDEEQFKLNLFIIDQGVPSTLTIGTSNVFVSVGPSSIESTIAFGVPARQRPVHRSLIFKNDNITKLGVDDAVEVSSGVLFNPSNDLVTNNSIGFAIIPSSNVTFDIGSPEKSWRDLYLSGNTIVLGSTTLSSEDNGALVVKDAAGNPKPIFASEVRSGTPENSSLIISSDGTIDLDESGIRTFVETSVAGIVNSAPVTLNTLNELAAALNDDANFSTTILNSLGSKASNTYVNSTFTTKTDSVAANNSLKSLIDSKVSSTTNTAFSGTVNFTNTISIDGSEITANAQELNYTDGVTSNIQTQLDTKASTGKAIAMAIVFGG